MVCEVQHSKGGKMQNYTLSPIIMEVGNGVPPILVSFHLGWFSTSMMGERVSTTYETSVSVFRFSLWLIEPRSFFSRRQGSSRWCLWELPAFTDFPGSKTWEASKKRRNFQKGHGVLKPPYFQRIILKKYPNFYKAFEETSICEEVLFTKNGSLKVTTHQSPHLPPLVSVIKLLITIRQLALQLLHLITLENDQATNHHPRWVFTHSYCWCFRNPAITSGC